MQMPFLPANFLFLVRNALLFTGLSGWRLCQLSSILATALLLWGFPNKWAAQDKMLAVRTV
jgi:hypothetical protein